MRTIKWCLYNTAAANDHCATPQRRSRHELAWIWTDFWANSVGRRRRATALIETTGWAARASSELQPVRCSRKTQVKFAIASMSKNLLHCCICAHARVHMHFFRRVCIHFWQELWAPCMCRCVRSTGVVNICVHICLHARYKMCICAHVFAVCSFSVGEQGFGGSANLWKHLLLGVGDYFWQKER